MSQPFNTHYIYFNTDDWIGDTTFTVESSAHVKVIEQIIEVLHGEPLMLPLYHHDTKISYSTSKPQLLHPDNDLGR